MSFRETKSNADLHESEHFRHSIILVLNAFFLIRRFVSREFFERNKLDSFCSQTGHCRNFEHLQRIIVVFEQFMSEVYLVSYNISVDARLSGAENCMEPCRSFHNHVLREEFQYSLQRISLLFVIIACSVQICVEVYYNI